MGVCVMEGVSEPEPLSSQLLETQTVIGFDESGKFLADQAHNRIISLAAIVINNSSQFSADWAEHIRYVSKHHRWHFGDEFKASDIGKALKPSAANQHKERAKFVLEDTLSLLSGCSSISAIHVIAIDKERFPDFNMIAGEDYLYTVYLLKLFEQISRHSSLQGQVKIHIDQNVKSTSSKERLDQSIIRLIKNCHPDISVEVEHVCSKKHASVQAADWVAWSIRRFYNTRAEFYFQKLAPGLTTLMLQPSEIPAL